MIWEIHYPAIGRYLKLLKKRIRPFGKYFVPLINSFSDFSPANVIRRTVEVLSEANRNVSLNNQ